MVKHLERRKRDIESNKKSETENYSRYFFSLLNSQQKQQKLKSTEHTYIFFSKKPKLTFFQYFFSSLNGQAKILEEPEALRTEHGNIKYFN